MTIEEISKEREKAEQAINRILLDLAIKIKDEERVFVSNISIINGMSSNVRHVSIHLSLK